METTYGGGTGWQEAFPQSEELDALYIKSENSISLFICNLLGRSSTSLRLRRKRK